MGNILENNFLSVHTKYRSYITNIIGLSLGTSEGNVVGVIIDKLPGCTLIATGGMQLG